MHACRRLSAWTLLAVLWSCCVTAFPPAAWAFPDELTAAAPPGADAAAPPTATPEAPASAAPTRRAADESGDFLPWLIRSSGVFGFLILLVGLALVFLIFTAAALLRRENFLPAPLLEQFERQLNEKNYPAAYETAKSSDTFLGKVLAAGMARAPHGYDDVLQGMQNAGDEETLLAEQAIGYFALIASVAPLLGLLGTVYGLMRSFQALATSAVAPRANELADGIATALCTTMEGLIVAVPALICYTLFRNRLARFVMECGFVGEELMRRFQPPAARPAASTTPPRAAAPLTGAATGAADRY